MARFRVQDDADQEEPIAKAYIWYVEERDDAVG
jgi:hypothetical protein